MHAVPKSNTVTNTASGLLYCHLWVTQMPIWSCFVLSTFNLVVLTLERYFSVVYPIKHKMVCTRNKVIASIVILWILAPVYQIAMNSPGVKILGDYCSVFAWSSERVQQAKGIFGSIVEYFLPLFLLMFCYGRMLCALRVRVAPTGNPKQPPAAAKNTTQARGKRNVIKMMTIVAVAYILCTSWNQWWYLLYNLKLVPADSYTTDYYDFSVIAMFSNCFINPFIYAAKYDEFKNGVKKIFGKGRKRDGKLSDNSSTVSTVG